MADQEGLIGLLGGSTFSSFQQSVPVVKAGAVEKRADVEYDLPAAVLDIRPEDEWADDPVSVKWTKIRSAFLNAKSAAQVIVEAAAMSTGQWLEMALKMAPKDVKVSAEVNFRHMLQDLGPIDKEQYRCSPPRMIEVDPTD